MTDSRRQTRLVLQASLGERDALEEVLSCLQGPLLGYITSVVGRTSADDVLQETLLQICRKISWLRDPELFKPWAYRIASRSCFKSLKKERRLFALENEAAPLGEEALLLQPELQLFLDMPELLMKISPASRAVLHLHYLQELSIQEVAAILDITVGTTKSRLAYGLSCLRQIISKKETT